MEKMSVDSDHEMTTFEFEQSLPHLPLPDLGETLDQLKKSLEPLYYADGYYKNPLDPGQISDLSFGLESFYNSSAASKLQEKLNEFHASLDCYLDNLYLDINNNSCAAEVGDDVLPRNPFLILNDDAVSDIQQTERASFLVNSSLRFISALRNEILTPDVNPKSQNPLSMRPYFNLFGTTRYPVFEKGEVESFDLNKPYTVSDLEYSSDNELDDTDNSREPSMDTRSTDENDIFSRHGITLKSYPNSKHILVISKGQYYTIDVLDEANNTIFSCAELNHIFSQILKDSLEICNFNSTALGSLTSHSYKNWKYARKRLQKRYPNELELIDSALFVLILDDSTSCEPADISEDCKRLFYGTSVIDAHGNQVGSCTSRWYDKLQLVVTGDSKSAFIWDSFSCDGSVILRFISEVYAESILRLASDVNGNDSKFTLWPKIKDLPHRRNKNDQVEIDKCVNKIEWSFSNILNTHIHLSETKLADLISKYDLSYSSIPFGSRAAMRFGVSADSMIQVALQIAHYALYGKMVYGLEPISTRGFKNSRSAFINLQSKELLELCQVFISNSLSGPGKLKMFVQACKLHHEKVKEAKVGKSFEKHFNALKHLYRFHEHFGIEFTVEEEKIAKNVFENSLIEPFSSPELIVANCGSAATSTFGITPAIPQGFGIGYIIKNDQCDLTVTSQFRQGKRLMFMLNWVLNELRDYLRELRAIDKDISGVKISPMVDRLYEMDNALKNTHLSKSSSGVAINGGFGFFDLKGHMDSRGVSVMNSRNNSSVSLGLTYFESKNVNDSNNTLHSTLMQSSNFQAPTEEEKLDTGLQIQRMVPSSSVGSEYYDTSRRPSTKRSNVIDSRFEINFDRGRVGRKVTTFQ
ncbi:hypothetical protein Kpol_1013p55 [Vanderwaltozyma polyspora DSM 70294]|uniref:Choline/carnitine acyltransferase domain-containing protein n=1 Tax=Vanderwaltozyma polyspora (strain ATCC 22028 / DSM 70294 / BCRC 21397 / CBS 2163 / NBRC 10782 / NRRL Y-8283 / UCD 57-17) TaxID=436907 RepID=A7THA2_VANPO|nr:uncharacterized protein Kpol_1013p55 [Vanderwaltozyma polyspora DSM 70294]EDO18383.1 hypothetical protein Kpol_1013p55 [Vanderwaltozyma polyspora DSM 70294]